MSRYKKDSRGVYIKVSSREEDNLDDLLELCSMLMYLGEWEQNIADGIDIGEVQSFNQLFTRFVDVRNLIRDHPNTPHHATLILNMRWAAQILLRLQGVIECSGERLGEGEPNDVEARGMFHIARGSYNEQFTDGEMFIMQRRAMMIARDQLRPVIDRLGMLATEAKREFVGANPDRLQLDGLMAACYEATEGTNETNRLTGEEIANKIGKESFGGDVKAALRGLVLNGLLINKKPGYFRSPPKS